MVLFAAITGALSMNLRAQNKTFDASYMDKSVSPKTDFFLFADGNWVKNNPVPKTESRWGSFNELQQENYVKIKKIFSDLANDSKRDTEATNLSNYYQSYINSNRKDINYPGIKTLNEVLSNVKIGESTHSKEFATTLAYLHGMGINVFFDFDVEQDLKNNTINVPYLSQPRLGLPNKDYYSGEKFDQYGRMYGQYLTTLTKSLMNEIRNTKTSTAQKGIITPRAQKIEEGSGNSPIAENALKTEMELSLNMFSPVELRDIARNYNPMSIDELKNLIPTFNWDIYFKTLGVNIGESKFVVVSQKPYFSSLAEFFANHKPADLESYIKTTVINSLAPYLNEDYKNLHFDFYQKYLVGKQEQKPIEEDAIDNITMLSIGDILGKYFVKNYFSEGAKNKINVLVDNLFAAFKERIEKLSWMSEETKKQALVKLGSFTRKLGYPDKWKDFSSLAALSDNNLTQNIINVRRFAVRDNLNDIGKPIDKQKWEMPAHMINAYYNPLQNEIVFPAGIMQAPFFDVNYEDAVNYARMGMIIGHEMTHGFDDQGAQFAADGTFSNWWTTEDKEKFDKLTKTYGETFAKFCPFKGICVNPELTMGENIADLGGITLAYYAYTRTDEFKKGKKVDGYTPAQRFFISYAQIWKTTYTDGELKNRIENDPHSPGMYRVNGPLMNTPEFFEAFKIKEGSPMRNPKGKMTVIW